MNSEKKFDFSFPGQFNMKKPERLDNKESELKYEGKKSEIKK